MLEQIECEGYQPRLLSQYHHPQAQWDVFYPVGSLAGLDQVATMFWQPLSQAIPDLERRVDILVADSYQGHYWVSCMGVLYGNFEQPLFGIPASHNFVHLRIGEFFCLAEGKIVCTKILFDLVDLMRQAGCYPFRAMLGSAGISFPPRYHNGVRLHGDDDPGREALQAVLGMHAALHQYDGENLDSMPQNSFWSPNFIYYAPAGIGTCRGLRDFQRLHQFPFLRSFPDRHGTEHYCRISDGPIACTSHWGTLTASHQGGSWLGLPPTDKKLTMRVADWYCCDQSGKLHENWLLLDLLDIYQQMGVDVLAELKMGALSTKSPVWP